MTKRGVLASCCGAAVVLAGLAVWIGGIRGGSPAVEPSASQGAQETPPPLAKNACVLIGREIFQKFVPYPDIEIEPTTQLFDSSSVACLAKTQGGSGVYVRASVQLTRHLPADGSSAREKARYSFDTQCKRITEAEPKRSEVRSPLPGVGELGGGSCGVLSKDKNMPFVSVRMTVLQGFDVVDIWYTQRDGDFTKTPNDAAGLAREVLAKL
ncbi:hypothetical protein [Actinopolymorpha alba]|uniref:hypothetical protein n=1 Tax=Actinopolymorpha alba TaxID=533267 RepID=UPI00146A61F9|nr:hypothetical protein [Actinopolymorpha alba]